MRVEVIGNNFEISEALRTHVESRVWLAAQRVGRHLSWIGVRLMPERARVADGRVTCQIDAWLQGAGLVTIRHTDSNAYLAIACAAVRLEQALIRRLRESGRRPTTATARRGGADDRREGRANPRLAVVILPADSPPRLSLAPWLRTRYGIEQLQNLSLSWAEWDALVADRLDSPRLSRLRARLALARLCRATAIVVVGGAVPQPSRDERPQARQEIERAVEHVWSLHLPLEVIGVWVNEHWTADDCLIESEELSLPRPRHGERTPASEEEPYAGRGTQPVELEAVH